MAKSDNTPQQTAVEPENAAIDISVVLPCLNEAETLEGCVRKARAAIESSGLSGEVIVADNGSTDGSQALALAAGARVVDVPIRGYGAALMAGIDSARGTYVLMADADGSYDFSHLPRFVEALRSGGELVMGNRFKGGIYPGAMPFLHRRLGNPLLSFIGRVFFKAPVRDFHCGIRAFSKSAIKSLRLTAPGMEFASEMVIRASLTGLRISEVPTTLSPDGRSRAPHLRTWHDGWRHLRLLLLYSPRWLFFYPGLILLLLGVLVTAWLLPGQRTFGDTTFDVDTLAYALGAILVGFHVCVFAISAKVLGVSQGMLPKNQSFDRWFQLITLERGVIAGAVVLLAGLIASIYALFFWYDAGFGTLDPASALRISLPAVTAILLGVEIIFASFFLSLLGNFRAEDRAADR
ncbi:MAG: glycosyltransferase family 2 protein [Candidatus Acidiferrales bacterium]